MTLTEAIHFIRPGIQPANGIWADIGAGTGLFTMALMHIMEEGTIIAVDKSPHALYSIKASSQIHFQVMEGDFNQPLQLPLMDGILMANALHYANDHITVLENVLASLREGGRFVLIEYDTEVPNGPWVPNPVSMKLFRNLCKQVGLSDPELIGERQSIYQDGTMYAVVSKISWNR
jgi:ubiquinone/menaquinone biosynthesis C-methylase UbiE